MGRRQERPPYSVRRRETPNEKPTATREPPPTLPADDRAVGPRLRPAVSPQPATTAQPTTYTGIYEFQPDAPFEESHSGFARRPAVDS